MTKPHRFASRVVGTAVLILLSSNVAAYIAQAAQENTSGKTTANVDSVVCPITQPDSIKHIVVNNIAMLIQGIKRSPCETMFKISDPQPKFDYYSTLPLASAPGY